MTGSLSHDLNNRLAWDLGSLDRMNNRFAQESLNELERYVTAAEGCRQPRNSSCSISMRQKPPMCLSAISRARPQSSVAGPAFQAGQQHLGGLGAIFTAVFLVAPKALELDPAQAAPEAQDEAAVRHVVEHRQLFAQFGDSARN